MISIDMLFNIINFVVRVGLVLYLIYRFIVPKISLSMSIQAHNVIVLEKEQSTLKNDAVQIKENIDQDRQYQQQLQKKFDQWHAAIQVLQEQENQECKMRQRNIEKLLDRRMHHVQNQKYISEQMPVVLLQVRKELEQDFAKNSELAQQYQSKIAQLIG
jgi:hypothetical protein